MCGRLKDGERRRVVIKRWIEERIEKLVSGEGTRDLTIFILERHFPIRHGTFSSPLCLTDIAVKWKKTLQVKSSFIVSYPHSTGIMPIFFSFLFFLLVLNFRR